MFQIKNFPSIVASMINRMRATQNQVTDFNPGAIARTMLESPAQEIDQLYQQMYWGLQDAIENATYNTFNFPLLGAVAGSTLLTLDITAQATDVVIPANSLAGFTGGATSYTTLSDVTITAGDTTAALLIAAVTPGAIGNIPANTPFTIVPSPAGFVSATNAAAIVNGTDAETLAQRKIRFQEFIAALARGIKPAIEYGAKNFAFLTTGGVVTERVVLAKVIEPYVLDNTQPPAFIYCYVHNGVGSTSPSLVAAAQLVINGYYDGATPVVGYKAAGVICTAVAATEVPLNVTGVITDDGTRLHADVVADVSAAIANYLLGLPLGAQALKAELYAKVMAVPGVSNFAMSAPSADTTITAAQKVMPGTLAIT